MLQQIETAAAAGANGVVLGVLRPQDNRVDVDAMKVLASAARVNGLKTTCHRAFDRGLVDAVLDHHAFECGARHQRLADDRMAPAGDRTIRRPVSYTHLTLPTSDLV